MNTIEQHYSRENLPVRVEAMLHAAGFGDGPIEWSALAPIDQFHARGLAATAELAAGLGLTGGETVLDVGCGLGGPARFLAAKYGCRVTGIDLTGAYIEVAEMLGRRTGLLEQLTFVQGDALHMPLEDAMFDHAWTQHVAMNIADKENLYREIARVMKPGGRLAIYDAVLGNGDPVFYPVPWAAEADISFLATPEQMQAALSSAGFAEVSAEDFTPSALAWFAGLQSAPPAGGANAFNLAALLGTEGNIGQAVANFARNLMEGRIRLMQVVSQKG